MDIKNIFLAFVREYLHENAQKNSRKIEHMWEWNMARNRTQN